MPLIVAAREPVVQSEHETRLDRAEWWRAEARERRGSEAIRRSLHHADLLSLFALLTGSNHELHGVTFVE